MFYLSALDANGKVLQVSSSQFDAIHTIGLNPEAVFHMEEPPPTPQSYWDFEANSWIEPQPQPSPAHVFNWQTKQREDPRTLQDFKEAQWALIKQARTSAEYAGFTWDGSTFDSDAISQNRITGAVTLAQMSPDFTIGWVLADNSVRTLNQMDMLQVGGALGQHVAVIFAKAAGLRAQIEAATTREAVESVVW